MTNENKLIKDFDNGTFQFARRFPLTQSTAHTPHGNIN